MQNNWFVAGNGDAEVRGTLLYTVIESRRRRGIDPHTYLKDVLTHLPTMTNHQIPEVTPEALARARLQLQRQAAA